MTPAKPKPLEGDVIAREHVQREPEDPKEHELTHYLALGYSYRESARLADVSLATVQRKMWVLREYVARLRLNVPADLEGLFYGNIALAMDVQRQMLSGEIEAKDERYLEARRIIHEWAPLLFFVDRSGPPPRPRTVEPAPEAPAEQLQLTGATE